MDLKEKIESFQNLWNYYFLKTDLISVQIFKIKNQFYYFTGVTQATYCYGLVSVVHLHLLENYWANLNQIWYVYVASGG